MIEEIAKALEKLAEKSVIDYLVIIMPIILSIIAIGISIATARKQNKIALFDRRYACLFQIRMTLQFAEAIKEVSNPKMILQLFDAFWGSNIATLKGDSQIIAAQCQLIIIRKEIEQAEFLFERKFHVLPSLLMDSLCQVITDALFGKDVEEPTIELNKVCDKFSKTDYKALKKYTKMHFYD